MMNKWTSLIAGTVGGAVMLLGSTLSANALELWLNDPAVTGASITVLNGGQVEVEDQGAGDASGTLGVVNFNGALGGGSVWDVNITTGISYPVLGSLAAPNMDLNSVNVSSTGGGVLEIFLFDIFDLASVANAILDIGGTTDGTVTVQVFQSSFANEILSLGPLGAGAFSATGFGNVADGDTALGILVTITHDAQRAGQVSSFDAELTVAEPGILGLLGLGLVGLGLARRRAA